MLISVIIPVYNEEKYLDQCLKSIAAQSVRPYEVIIIDNNSSDSSVDIAKKYGVKIVRETIQGIMYARNRGFDEAKGDIIARTDADCVTDPHWIKNIEKNFKTPSNIIGLTGPVYFYDVHMEKISQLLIHTYSFVLRKILKTHVFIGGNMILTKKGWNLVKKDICPDEESVHEDVDISVHLSKYGEIYYDQNLKIGMSGRRAKNKPQSFFIDYFIRLIRTIRVH